MIKKIIILLILLIFIAGCSLKDSDCLVKCLDNKYSEEVKIDENDEYEEFLFECTKECKKGDNDDNNNSQV